MSDTPSRHSNHRSGFSGWLGCNQDRLLENSVTFIAMSVIILGSAVVLSDDLPTIVRILASIASVSV